MTTPHYINFIIIIIIIIHKLHEMKCSRNTRKPGWSIYPDYK